MGTGIRQLRRQANEIQNEIARLQRESEQRDRRYQRDHDENMRRLRTEMETALQRQDRHRYTRIQQQMSELNEQMMNQMQKNHATLKRQLTSNLESRHRELLQQMDAYYQKVQRQIDDEIANVQQEKEAERKETAQRELSAAQIQYNKTAMRPHEELFPGKMQIFHGTLIQAEKMIQQNQPQASAATSAMLNVSLKDFEYSINECLDRILQRYLKFECLYIQLNDQMQNEVLTIDDVTLNEDTARYWLDNSFSNVFGIMEWCRNLVEQMHAYTTPEDENMVSAAVVERFIKGGTTVRERELDEMIRELKYQLPGDMKKMQIHLQSAYRCSAQRKNWAEKIMNYMRQYHNTGMPVYYGFNDGDEADMYCIKFVQPSGNSAKSEYVFHIVPELMNGNMVNHIRIFMNFRSGNSVFEKKEEQKYIKNILRAIQETSVYIGIGRSRDILDGNSDTEYIIQPAAGSPSKMQLVKKSPAEQSLEPAAANKSSRNHSYNSRNRQPKEKWIMEKTKEGNV